MVCLGHVVQATDQGQNIGVLTPSATSTSVNAAVDQQLNAGVLVPSATYSTAVVNCKLDNLPAFVALERDQPAQQVILLEPLDGLVISGMQRINQRYLVTYGNSLSTF